MITNYSDLQLAIQQWLNRPNEASVIPTFIQLCENKLSRSLRIRQMEVDFTGTIASGVFPVPTGYLEMKRFYVSTSPATKLTRKGVGWIDYFYPRSNGSNVPKYFARDADNFIFGPYPDSSYNVGGTYYAKITPLSDAAPTNWYTSDAPELLLYGSLLEAEPYIKDDSRMQLWKGLFEEAKAAVILQDKRESTRGSIMSGDYECS